MQRELIFINDPIAEPVRQMRDDMGAVVTFHGVVRGEENGAPITAIDYEANEPMAQHQFELIFEAMEKQWPLESVGLIHRLGVVPVNEPSLWVEVVAAHRAEAFAACQFLIDEMKLKVPIWKRVL